MVLIGAGVCNGLGFISLLGGGIGSGVFLGLLGLALHKVNVRLVNQEGRRELAGDLATAYTNKANAVGALGDKRSAVALYDQTVEEDMYPPTGELVGNSNRLNVVNVELKGFGVRFGFGQNYGCRPVLEPSL